MVTDIWTRILMRMWTRVVNYDNVDADDEGEMRTIMVSIMSNKMVTIIMWTRMVTKK